MADGGWRMAERRRGVSLQCVDVWVVSCIVLVLLVCSVCPGDDTENCEIVN